MRKDMWSVIIDRPRTGGDGGKSRDPKGYKKRIGKIPLDEAPNRESSARGRKYGSGCKRLNEHLSPLRRFLRSCVGRPWNEVYSEICENISLASASQSHVRDHVDWEVEKNTRLDDNGDVVDSKGRQLFTHFYVHPLSGVLCIDEMWRKRWRREPGPKNYVEGKDGQHQYRLMKGVWYEVELALYPPLSVSDDHRWIDEYGREVYVCKKRQLNHREIKRAKLWETPLGVRAREESCS